MKIKIEDFKNMSITDRGINNDFNITRSEAEEIKQRLEEYKSNDIHMITKTLEDACDKIMKNRKTKYVNFEENIMNIAGNYTRSISTLCTTSIDDFRNIMEKSVISGDPETKVMIEKTIMDFSRSKKDLIRGILADIRNEKTFVKKEGPITLTTTSVDNDGEVKSTSTEALSVEYDIEIDDKTEVKDEINIDDISFDDVDIDCILDDPDDIDIDSMLKSDDNKDDVD